MFLHQRIFGLHKGWDLNCDKRCTSNRRCHRRYYIEFVMWKLSFKDLEFIGMIFVDWSISHIIILQYFGPFDSDRLIVTVIRQKFLHIWFYFEHNMIDWWTLSVTVTLLCMIQIFILLEKYKPQNRTVKFQAWFFLML